MKDACQTLNIGEDCELEDIKKINIMVGRNMFHNMSLRCQTLHAYFFKEINIYLDSFKHAFNDFNLKTII